MTNSEKKILFVDLGSKDSKNYFGGIFEEEPVLVTSVYSFSELQQHQHNVYDLVVIRQRNDTGQMDLLVDYVKQYSRELHKSVVVLSSFDKEEYFFKHLAHGFFYYISVPCSKNYLKNRVFEILYNRDLLPGNNNECELRLNMHEENYLVNLNSDDLNNFITSMCDNSVHQNVILSKVLKQDNSLLYKITNTDIFDSDEFDDADRESILNDLTYALERQEMHMYYQPIISISDRSIIGFESLLRWHHPVRGIMTPDDFVGIAEQSNLIIDIGVWVIREVAEQVAIWQKKYNLHKDFRIGINLSAKQFIVEELCDIIFNIVKEFNLDNHSLAFEITETSFMRDMDAANLTLLKLHSKNHSIYLDDFGTGYSSLSYLQHFPVDVLKIDKSFVRWMHIDEQSEKIVKTIIDLAHNLGMQVVAEGVEEPKHLAKLKKMGCDYAQGFYYAKALQKDDAEDFLTEKIIEMATGSS